MRESKILTGIVHFRVGGKLPAKAYILLNNSVDLMSKDYEELTFTARL